jgi:hypothetical protein
MKQNTNGILIAVCIAFVSLMLLRFGMEVLEASNQINALGLFTGYVVILCGGYAYKESKKPIEIILSNNQKITFE